VGIVFAWNKDLADRCACLLTGLENVLRRDRQGADPNS
jgi:hypothetical protein